MTTSAIEITLIAAPQTCSFTLAGMQYRLTLQYRDAAKAGWTLDIADANSQPLVCGIPLVTGVDLRGPHPDLDIKGQLWVQTDANPDAVPTFSGLGRESRVYFVAQ